MIRYNCMDLFAHAHTKHRAAPHLDLGNTAAVHPDLLNLLREAKVAAAVVVVAVRGSVTYS